MLGGRERAGAISGDTAVTRRAARAARAARARRRGGRPVAAPEPERCCEGEGDSENSESSAGDQAYGRLLSQG